ncbi:methyltransferase domain-containing protein [Epibacterium ulvae]|uniref:methyltransferase domain-containing protein n=1 Tax=Epibacterium ulvae TaxID=1156985 RepID=UPI0024935DA2|nr:class I SAM-dependent methyltransferase [Epibacterium ulvae]
MKTLHWVDHYYSEGDVLARGDHELYFQPRRIELEVELTLKALRDNSSVPGSYLNLACGPNVQCLLKLLKALPLHTAVCADINPSFVKFISDAFEKSPYTSSAKTRFEVADMRLTFLYGQKFDLISLYGNSFGYFEHSINQRILEQCHRLLNTGGMLALTTVNHDMVARQTPENAMSWRNDVMTPHGPAVRYSTRYFNSADNRSICNFETRLGNDVIESGVRDLFIYPYETVGLLPSLSQMALEAKFSRTRRLPLPINDETFGLMKHLDLITFEK